MTPDLSLLRRFARRVLLSLHVRDTCLHSGLWLLSGSFPLSLYNPYIISMGFRVWGGPSSFD